MQAAVDTLRHVFGYDAFRGAQGDIVAHVAGGGDALVLMPTGGGKSLCYQLPALLREGTAIVVSPLIALMQDQVEALRQLGVRAAFLNSSLDAGAALAVADGPGAPGAVRHRRSALRVAVGPRLPSGIPPAHAAARTLAGRAAHRAHRHGRCAYAARDRRAAEAGRSAGIRQLLRPA